MKVIIRHVEKQVAIEKLDSRMRDEAHEWHDEQNDIRT
jgi:hypothetical protein